MAFGFEAGQRAIRRASRPPTVSRQSGGTSGRLTVRQIPKTPVVSAAGRLLSAHGRLARTVPSPSGPTRTTNAVKVGSRYFTPQQARVLKQIGSSGNRPIAGLAPDQQKVLKTVLNVGSRLGASPKEKVAAVETGLVESNLRNLPGGSGTSQGWRQETAQARYPNPRNVKASATRFFQEAQAAGGGRGQPAYSLAQQVQGSGAGAGSGGAATYGTVRPQARSLLRAYTASKTNPKVVRKAKRLGVRHPLASAPQGPARSGYRYANPAPGQVTGRSDQGIDYGLPSGAPTVAVGKGKVLGTGSSVAAGWPGGGGVLYRLTSGPQKGKAVYVFEDVAATVRPGQRVKRGQVIGRGTGGSIETGYYDVKGGHPLNNITLSGGQVYSVASTDGSPTRGSAQFAKQILGKATNAPITGGGAAITSGVVSSGGVSAVQVSPQGAQAIRKMHRQGLTGKQILAKLRSLGVGSATTSTDTPTSVSSASLAALEAKYGKAVV